jgi:hypothetical protein
MPPGTTFSGLSAAHPVIGEGGKVLFGTTTGIWIGTSLTDLAPVVVLSGGILNLPGATITGLFASTWAMNDAGQVAFPARAQIGSQEQRLMCAWDPSFGLVSLLHIGQQIEIEPGVPLTVSNIASLSGSAPTLALSGGQDGHTSFLNDAGQVAVRVDFANLDTAMMVLTIAAPGSSCYANCDQSTTSPILNVNDFQCFLNRYAAGDSYANCDGSVAAPVLNVNDFICFNNAFASGCP